MNVLKTKKEMFAALGTAAALLTLGGNAFAQVGYGVMPQGVTYGQSNAGLLYGQTAGSTVMEAPVITYPANTYTVAPAITPSLTYDGPVVVTPQYQVVAQSYDANMDSCYSRANVYNYYTYNVYSYNSFNSSLVYQGQQVDGPYYQTTTDTVYSGPCQ